VVADVARRWQVCPQQVFGWRRAMLPVVLEQRDTLAAERDAAVAQNERLPALLAKLPRVQFGRTSERLAEDQSLFGFEEIEATLAQSAAEAPVAVEALERIGELMPWCWVQSEPTPSNFMP
jgi:hypothetical protein